MDQYAPTNTLLEIILTFLHNSALVGAYQSIMKMHSLNNIKLEEFVMLH
jgi:hypothetical protein